ncbi:similar to DNA-BINDING TRANSCRIPTION FACTOR 2 [Actinidia rufa]|uniref:Similar to DNA-BINDING TRANSCRIPTION FACTOR 2 n=1 Tax=Actinidia rufa TaxID=165716 RepID=A0A7J0G9X2_9ERIC|nr:similar to DNA-BINDING TRANSCRIPTION FACTOR 2 [Actinidia rufa]
MESILQAHNTQMPTREVLDGLAEKFSASVERSGKITVQMKQVWNWFQNRRYAIRAKAAKAPGKLTVSPMPRDDSTAVRNVPQAPQSVTALSAVQSVGRPVSDNSQMEFEAKSARDGAWYDVSMFLSHRSLETGDPEGKEQALYFDAHVLDAQRRRHDVRGCRCRFLVRYDHDQSEEIVPLRKVCRRPETDYRLQQLHTKNEPGCVDPHNGNTLRVYPPAEPMQKQQRSQAAAAVPPASHGNVSVTIEAKVLQPKNAETSGTSPVTTSTGGDMDTSPVPPANVAPASGAATNTATIEVAETFLKSWNRETDMVSSVWMLKKSRYRRLTIVFSGGHHKQPSSPEATTIAVSPTVGARVAHVRWILQALVQFTGCSDWIEAQSVAILWIPIFVAFLERGGVGVEILGAVSVEVLLSHLLPLLFLPSPFPGYCLKWLWGFLDLMGFVWSVLRVVDHKILFGFPSTLALVVTVVLGLRFHAWSKTMERFMV